jgi:hypothetical protein
MASLNCLAVGILRVPLKRRCSMKWEAPAISSDSYREPVPTKMLTLTE